MATPTPNAGSTPDVTYPRVVPVGETAFTVEFGNAVTLSLNQQVHALDGSLVKRPIPGIEERVPTYRSLLVLYDPTVISAAAISKRLTARAQSIASRTMDEEGDQIKTGRLIEIPVQYGGDAGPDLLDVAAHCGISPEEVVRRHTAPFYQVAMLGFAPGFTYLLGLPPELATPRLDTPRLRVPPGSVGIAGAQTGIYALATPGGWRLIGRTNLKLFQPDREAPFTIKAGDCVRFVVAGHV